MPPPPAASLPRQTDSGRALGRTLEERLRIEAETTLSMFLRKDKHSHGAQAFLDKNLKPEWPHHGL
ncbi:unnamed protein product [marine sediment metagenome]|uniref:Enoyl-CoA hydratase/isomerase n=1 Tax=marine sediment metagenome TaxID=412755 RepID=X0T2L8_9ZZZZ